MLIVLLDSSESMGEYIENNSLTKLEVAKRELINHFAKFDTIEQVVLIEFNDSSTEIFNGNSRDVEQIELLLNRVNPRGGTDIAAALYTVHKIVNNNRASKVQIRVLVISDGLSELKQASKAAKKLSKIVQRIDVIHIGTSWQGINVARAVARNGTVSYVSSSARLRHVLKTLSSDTKRRRAYNRIIFIYAALIALVGLLLTVFTARRAPGQDVIATTTAIALAVPATLSSTQIAAIPIQIVASSGVVIGDGTLRVYYQDMVQHSETVKIELELEFDNRYVTATPTTPGVSLTPPQRITSTPFPSRVIEPTLLPKHETTGIEIYQLMGASLLCSQSSFTGCDEIANKDTATHINLEGRSWVWILSPSHTAAGPQDLRLTLWTLSDVATLGARNNVIWDHDFSIDIKNPTSSDNWLAIFLRENAGGLLVAFIGIAGVIGAALIGRDNVERIAAALVTLVNRQGDNQGLDPSPHSPTATINPIAHTPPDELGKQDCITGIQQTTNSSLTSNLDHNIIEEKVSEKTEHISSGPKIDWKTLELKIYLRYYTYPKWSIALPIHDNLKKHGISVVHHFWDVDERDIAEEMTKTQIFMPVVEIHIGKLNAEKLVRELRVAGQNLNAIVPIVDLHDLNELRFSETLKILLNYNPVSITIANFDQGIERLLERLGTR